MSLHVAFMRKRAFPRFLSPHLVCSHLSVDAPRVCQDPTHKPTDPIVHDQDLLRWGDCRSSSTSCGDSELSQPPLWIPPIFLHNVTGEISKPSWRTASAESHLRTFWDSTAGCCSHRPRRLDGAHRLWKEKGANHGQRDPGEKLPGAARWRSVMVCPTDPESHPEVVSQATTSALWG